jgi:glucose/arabinose dehydrogenase
MNPRMVVRGSRRFQLILAAFLGALVQGACDDTEDTLGPQAGAAGTAGATGGSGETGSGATAGSDTASGGAGAEAGGGSGTGGSDVSPGGDGGASAGMAGTGGQEALAPSCARATGSMPELKLTEIAAVNDPVQLVSPPGDPRLFVVSRAGDIIVMEHDGSAQERFLSLNVATYYAEVGLLGLAFHPSYAENGLFYVHYIAPRSGDADGDLIVAEYERSDDPNRARPNARRVFFRLPQPTHKHKGGSMVFDSEGLLYIGLGNGGEKPWSGDETVLQGKVLRIDPAPEEDSYRIPAKNPQREGWLPEILETGLRNPWRIALDPCTDDLYIGDVGNATFEEINVSPASERGHDFGFPKLEGEELECELEDEDCSDEGTTPPLTGFGHDEGCAIIGGAVYRGSNVPALRGTYVYSDLCEGLFRTFRYEDGALEDERDITDDLNPDRIQKITSFGSDAAGELYVMSLGTDRVYRIDPE